MPPNIGFLVQARGIVRSLGVSNFGTRDLRELYDFAIVKPTTVQNKSAYL